MKESNRYLKTNNNLILNDKIAQLKMINWKCWASKCASSNLLVDKIH